MFFTISLTTLVWLTQSLKLLDVVINQGQSARTFIELSLFVMPSLLGIIMPVAFLCAIIYAINRLHTDSEVVVMWSAGLSRWSVAAPVLTLAMIVTVLVYSINLYLMPAGMRAMKDRVFEIRSDLVAFMLREGQFANHVEGLTVYVREVNSVGEVRGLLVYDDRDKDDPVTYMAETGKIIYADNGPRLLMLNGNIQSETGEENRLAFLSFDRHTLDLNQFDQEMAPHVRETSERYLGELLYPNANADWDRRYWDRLIAEGHNRLASPLYALAFAGLALTALIGGDFSRRGYSKRIGVAVVAAVIVRLSGVGIQSAATSAPALNVVQYLLPIGTLVIALVLLEKPQWLRNATWPMPARLKIE